MDKDIYRRIPLQGLYFRIKFGRKTFQYQSPNTTNLNTKHMMPNFGNCNSGCSKMIWNKIKTCISPYNRVVFVSDTDLYY